MIADVLLNCSGHKLTQRAMTELSRRFGQIEDVPVPTIRFEDDVEQQLRDMLGPIKVPLDGSVTVAIIPPGQATVAILLLAYLNGILGYFPALCYLSAEHPGDYLPQCTFFLDPQRVRDQGRLFRQSQWRDTKPGPL